MSYCSSLTTNCFNTIIIGDSVAAGLNRYRSICTKYLEPLKTLNCGIGGDRVQNVLWRAQNLLVISSLKNVDILCGTNNLFHDSPEDIANGIVETAQTFQSSYISIKIVIGGILPRDASWSINRVLIKEVNQILKAKCSKTFFIYISCNSWWTFTNGSLNPDLFFLHNAHQVEKANLKLAESIFNSIKNCNSVTCNKHKQFPTSYKMAVSFKLTTLTFHPYLFLLNLSLLPLFLLHYHLLLHVVLPVILVLFFINFCLILRTSVMVLFVQVMSILVNLFIPVNLCL